MSQYDVLIGSYRINLLIGENSQKHVFLKILNHELLKDSWSICKDFRQSQGKTTTIEPGWQNPKVKLWLNPYFVTGTSCDQALQGKFFQAPHLLNHVELSIKFKINKINC